MPTTVLSNLHTWSPWILTQLFELETLLFPFYRWGTWGPQEMSLAQVIWWMNPPHSWNGNSTVCGPGCRRAEIKASGKSLKENTRSESTVLVMWADGKNGKRPVCWEAVGSPWPLVGCKYCPFHCDPKTTLQTQLIGREKAWRVLRTDRTVETSLCLCVSR